jgi:hypothetical protein
MPLDVFQADRLVEQALAQYANKRYSGDLDRAQKSLEKGDCALCRGFSAELAEHISGYLSAVDGLIRAVYTYEPEKLKHHADETVYINPMETRAGINLLVLVNQDDPSLLQLVRSTESAIQESLKKLGCTRYSDSCFFVDVQTVTEKQVNENRGLGVLVGHPSIHSIPLWKSEDSALLAAHLQHPRPEVPATNLPVAAYDLELIPETTLLAQAEEIENMPEQDRKYVEHRLRELRVVLIRRLISDQLAYINLAKEWLTISDLRLIHERRISTGRIGGKSAGLLLAFRILNDLGSEELRESICIPESYYVGSDLLYLFMAMNGLMHWNNQKYKSEEAIRAEYPELHADIMRGSLPPEAVEELRATLIKIGNKPIIVRSSSQLEDNFGTSFAGKYESHFCPNQGNLEENLAALTSAMKRIYASTLNPDALLYRRSKGLLDYDERMAVLLQTVEGERFGRYFLPFASGVAFSRNFYRWAPQIRREDGFARMVWGLGTRAVERVGNDYPHLVALSHPLLQPDDSPEAMRYYSQQYVDLLDLEENVFKTLPIHEVLNPEYPPLNFAVQLERDGIFATPRSRVMTADIAHLSITFDELLRRTSFPTHLSQILRLLEETYRLGVDLEFTAAVDLKSSPKPKAIITLLQCRPQSRIAEGHAVKIPKDLKEKDILFATSFMVPQGYVDGVRYVIFVPPDGYHALQTQTERNELTQAISHLNGLLADKTFICVGPGRWGTTNPELGVFISYSDIYHSAALVELSGEGVGLAPEPSLGTHFFQDLMEAQIFPLAVTLGKRETRFNKDFFYGTPNHLDEKLGPNKLNTCLRLIDVAEFSPDHHLDIVMDDEEGRAVAYLEKNQT